MKLQVTLALICVLFPKALALQCYECKPDLSGTCTDTQTNCPDQCASVNAFVNIGGQRQDINVKGCAIASECVSGSLNLGVLKMTMNSKCCSSDLCNSQTTAALPFGSPNGKTCYACTGNDCTGTVSCEGNEDRCISSTVTSGGIQVKMKGCVSRSFCTADASSMQTAGITGSVSCCEGNLCNSAEGVNGTEGVNGAEAVSGTEGFNGTEGVNGAEGVNGTEGVNGAEGVNGTEGVKLSLLIMLVPLISSILFI